MRRAFPRYAGWYVGATLALAAADLAFRGAPAPRVLFFAGWGLVFGWAAFRIAARAGREPLLLVAVAVVGYHALFGPAMLLHDLTRAATRNDDLALRAYPHLIAWIDRFE